MKLERCLKAGPVLIWGPPGVGKSATVAAIGRKLAMTVETVVASIREPADFGGLPILTPEGVRMEPPAWAKRLARAGRGILFLDEVSTAAPAVQAALLRVVLDRVVGDLELPRQVYIVAAANPPEIAAGGWELSAPLANRFIHLHYKVDPRRWSEGFPSYWGAVPQTELNEEAWRRARALVAGFIRARPHLLFQIPEGAQQGLAWPSPRSWDMASRVLASCDDLEEALEGIQGAVGEGACLEFYSWAQMADLPDPESLLQNPGAFKAPKRGDLLFAILSGVVAAVVSHPTADRWEAVWEILAQAAEHGPDVMAGSVGPLIDLVKAGQFGLPRSFPRVAQTLLPVLKAAGIS